MELCLLKKVLSRLILLALSLTWKCKFYFNVWLLIGAKICPHLGFITFLDRVGLHLNAINIILYDNRGKKQFDMRMLLGGF